MAINFPHDMNKGAGDSEDKPNNKIGKSRNLLDNAALKINTIKVITDEPTLDDALDFNSYSENLANIIINSDPRFAIGIFGPWGTGKTSLMRMIENKIREKNSDDVLIVWFDAWKYEKEEYLAVVPFLRTISIAIENKMQNNTDNTKIVNWRYIRKGVERTFTAFVNSTNINVGFGNNISTHLDLAEFANILKADGSVVIAGERIHYHSHVTDHLAQTLSDIRQGTKNNNFRIVVFIDDLDRCMPEKSIEVLESIKTFFDIEGIVYVVGMDPTSINAIVEQKYANKQMKGSDYLQKIIQLTFQIPTWKKGDILQSISKIISNGLGGSDLIKEFEEK